MTSKPIYYPFFYLPFHQWRRKLEKLIDQARDFLVVYDVMSDTKGREEERPRYGGEEGGGGGSAKCKGGCRCFGDVVR
jgi:hypothetical protein